MAIMLWATLCASCAGSDPIDEGHSDAASDSSVTADVATPPSDTADAPSDTATGYTHKMFKATGENVFAKLAYDCNACTFEQFAAIEVPDGWSKGPTQVLLPKGEMRSTPSFEGVPDAMDFVDEVPGEEYILIAKTLSGTLIETGENGLFAEVQVMRDTIFHYAAGSRVHELTNPDGDVYVLFVYEIDPTNPSAIDFQEAEVLGDFYTPDGWTYETRILEEELIMDTPEVATVLAVRGETTSAWQKR